MALIILNSLFWFFLIIVGFSREGLRYFLNPRLVVGLAIIISFSSIPDRNEVNVGVSLLVSTFFILLGLGKKEIKIHGLEGANPRFLSDSKAQNIFLLVCIIFSLLNFTNLFILGLSPAEILLKFRTHIDIDYYQNTNALKSFIEAFNLFPVWGLAIGRVWFHTNGNKFTKLIWVILFILVLLTKFSTGTRGYLVAVLFCILIVDVFVEFRFGLHVLAKNKAFYILLLSLVLTGALFLTVFRTQKFYSIGDVVDSVEETLFLEKSERMIAEDYSIKCNGAISYLMDNYLLEPNYFQGIYAQLVNPVPRLVWGNKPYDFGRILAHEMMGAPLEGQYSYGFSGGVVGEAIYNGGIFGILIFSFLMGKIFSFVEREIKQGFNIIHITSAILFLDWGYFLIRGTWLTGFNFPLYNCLFAGLVLWVVGWIVRMQRVFLR
ncbi:MAG TPA: O-antigen polymerase [bacterium]|nr:O-antigen polymerase [bacterium]